MCIGLVFSFEVCIMNLLKHYLKEIIMKCNDLLQKLQKIQLDGYDLDKIDIMLCIDYETLKDSPFLYITGTYHQKCDENNQSLELYYHQ